MSPVRDDAATTAAAGTPARNGTATIPCPVCGKPFRPEGRQRVCSTRCRQQAWRRRSAAPVEPLVAKADTIYECPDCEARYLGEQRCDDCNTWCRKLGPGGPCPHCDEAVAINDILTPEQLARSPKRRR